jgi:glycosyltransferase involved in cell wall biosynthesis
VTVPAAPAVLLAADEVGFPRGGAASGYVRLLARGLVLAGVPTRVLALDYTDRAPAVLNTEARGEHQGVAYEYLTGNPVLPPSPLGIVAGRARARLALAPRIQALHRDGGVAAVVYYGRYWSLLAHLSWACRKRRVPLLANIVEWRPAFHGQTPGQRVNDRLFCEALPGLDGAVVISSYIEDRVKSLTPAGFPCLRIPILADPEPWCGVDPAPSRGPYVLLCADFDSYPEDAVASVRALAMAPTVDLVLVGKGSEATRRRITEAATAAGCAGRVVLRSEFVPEAELRRLYVGARALLAPLPDTERSRARFPSKLADYLLAGRPVVSHAVGEVGALLRDGETAYLASPADPEGLGLALRAAVTAPDAEAVGRRGRALAEAALDHRLHGRRLRDFIASLRR